MKMTPVIGILKRSRNDVTSRTPRPRSLYSDMVLAEQYTNYLEIIDNIKTRPRMPSPVNSRSKAVRWSDRTNMARSASFDHLLTMREACQCSCDTAHIPGLSQSFSDLVSVQGSDPPQYDQPRHQQYDDPCQVWRQTRLHSHYTPGMDNGAGEQETESGVGVISHL